jgi:DNA-nicking Smr family endonuclease
VPARDSDHDHALWRAATAGSRPVGRHAAQGVDKTPSLGRPRHRVALPAPARRTLDLHGLTLAEAHRAVIDAVMRAHAAGVRTLHVVTGKSGRIRGEIRHWLDAANVRVMIGGVSAAARHRGGDGALEIAVKRPRR